MRMNKYITFNFYFFYEEKSQREETFGKGATAIKINFL